MTATIDRREFLVGAAAAASLAATDGLVGATTKQGIQVVRLRVDYLDKPLGLESARPQLSWCLESADRNIRQGAYQIWVASSESALGSGRADLWDSGKVFARQSFGISYQGRALHSRQRCWWRVQAWAEAGHACEPSAASWWEMGLLSPDDWTARWLEADDALAKADRETPLQWMWGTGAGERSRFRCRFSIPTPATGGVLFTFGRSHGYENVREIWLDGIQLGRDIPVQDLAGELISLPDLSPGDHLLAIEIHLKNPQAQSQIGYTPQFGLAVFARLNGDGTERVTSGSGWKTSTSEHAAWHQPAYDDEAWNGVTSTSIDSKLVPDPVMHLRRGFVVAGEVRSARLYVTALGCYEARMNGKRVGDALLTPGVTQYDKRTLYQIYDVKDLLCSGGNVMGLVVGDGWYGSDPGRYTWGPAPRRVIAQLELTLADGSRQIVDTTPEWRISRSPFLRSELATGVQCDSRLDQKGWDTVGFDDTNWPSAQAALRPSCELRAQVTPPVRAIETLRPKSISNPKAGVYVFDFGQNFAGWCRLHAKGAAGTRIDLQFAEEVTPSGEIDQFVLLGKKAIDTFILSGSRTLETFEPCFAYHGFRYVQVTGLPGPPSVDSLEGIVIGTDLEVTGEIRTDNLLIQKIWHNAFWSQRSTFVAIDTDEVARDERFGYMTASFWQSAAFNMDVAGFARQQMDAARAIQSPNGAFPIIAPAPKVISDRENYEKLGTAPGWSDGGVILPWTIWRQYGDEEIILQNWGAMNRYLQFILANNPGYIWKSKRGDDFGDWLAIGENPYYHPDKPPTTPLDLFATAYWAHSTALLAQMSAAIGKVRQASKLRAVHRRICNAFNKAFVRPDGRVGNESQTCYVLALKFELIPTHLRAAAAEWLVRDIRQRGMALSTGFFGTEFLLDVLAEAGYAETAYNLLLRTENPSWGFMIEHGATTMWERWDGDLDHLHNEASHNHNMLGSVCGFLFRRVAGIDTSTPGFDSILIRPALDDRVRAGGGEYRSIMGRIATDWVQRENGELSLDVTIPANATARVHLPARPADHIYESGRSISSRRDVRIVRRLNREAVLEIASGRYQFLVSA